VNNVSKNLKIGCHALMPPLLDVNIAFWIIFCEVSLGPS
jgi:hypothetical protein